MRMGLISGHGAGDCGAVGCGYEEANETVRVVRMLAEKFEACGRLPMVVAESLSSTGIWS